MAKEYVLSFTAEQINEKLRQVVPIDSSLANVGQAADAKAVGDALALKQPIGNYLTSESDPTVPAWAKAATKPTYTASEVGAVEKTTYEYNRQLDIGKEGRVCIGRFPMYDSIIAVTINSSTDVTYHGTLVIATQNINTSHGGTYSVIVYGDAKNSLTDRIKIEYVNGSNVFSVYIDLPLCSKHLLHIQFISSRGEPTDIATLVDEIPSTATIVPTNAYDNYLLKSGGKITGPISFEGEVALPQKCLQYVCGIDPFKDGGELGWQSVSSLFADYAKKTDIPTSHSAGSITAGTFAGQVVASASGQSPSVSCLRNSRLSATEENPTVEGEIVWQYE